MAVAAPALAALAAGAGGAGAAAGTGAALAGSVGAFTGATAAASAGAGLASTALTALQVGAPILGGLAQYSQQQAAAAQDKINARISETQANQIDAARREELDASLGAVNAARAANGLGSSTTGRAINSEFRRVLDRDRSIEVGNKRSQAASFRASARSRRSAANFSLLSGGLQGGIPLLRSAF